MEKYSPIPRNRKNVATKVAGQRSLGEAEVNALKEEQKVLRTEIADMESADLDMGDFHEQVVASEVKSLKINFKKYSQLQWPPPNQAHSPSMQFIC